MCAGPGEEFCDECFSKMREGDTDENWPCEECKERSSRICDRCGVEQDDPLPSDEDICGDCVAELAGYGPSDLGDSPKGIAIRLLKAEIVEDRKEWEDKESYKKIAECNDAMKHVEAVEEFLLRTLDESWRFCG